MNITCECVDMRTSASSRNTITVEMEGVVLSGTVKTSEVLMQLDANEVIEWLSSQGYTITQQELAA